MSTLSIKDILGLCFSPLAFLLGVPWEEASRVGGLMGTKLVVNEFVAYLDMTHGSGHCPKKRKSLPRLPYVGLPTLALWLCRLVALEKWHPNVRLTWLDWV